jgi:zinc transporter ZupT
VSRRRFQFVAGVVLLLAALTPLTESFDHWDHISIPASDTEIHLTGWFVGVGIVLTLATLLKYVPSIVGSSRGSDRVLPVWRARRLGSDDRLEVTGSPPPIPLRI